MNFTSQVKRAKNLSASTGNRRKFLTQAEKARSTKLSNAIKSKDTSKYVSLLRTKELNKIHANAYKAKRGYSIGTVNNEKVMYVSGSRNSIDWALNFVGPLVKKKHRYVQKTTASRLDKIARENNVDVVIGHSRGGALVSAMPGGSYTKGSVDGAMIIANDPSIYNVSQKQPLDMLIAMRGQNNHFVKARGGLKNWHYVMRI